MEFTGALVLHGPAVASWQESSPEHRGALFELGHKLWDQRTAVQRDDAVAELHGRLRVAEDALLAAKAGARADAAAERDRLEARLEAAQAEKGLLTERVAAHEKELRRFAEARAEEEEHHVADVRRQVASAETAAHAAFREREAEAHRLHAAEVARLVSQIPTKTTSLADIGKAGEAKAAEAIAATVPGSVLVDKSSDAGCGDLWWTPPACDKSILVEVKNYGDALPLKEVEKFKRDVTTHRARLCGAALLVYGTCPSVPTFPSKLTIAPVDGLPFLVVRVAETDLASALIAFLEVVHVCRFTLRDHREADAETARHTHLMLQGVLTRAKATLADAEAADKNFDSAVKQTRLASEKSKKSVESARLSITACETFLAHLFPAGGPPATPPVPPAESAGDDEDVDDETVEMDGDVSDPPPPPPPPPPPTAPPKTASQIRSEMLTKLKVPKLKEMAKDMGIKHYGSMRKHELIKALR